MVDSNTSSHIRNHEVVDKKLVRITTVPMSLDLLITGQMKYMAAHEWDVSMMSAAGPEIVKVIEREGCEHIIIPMTRKITPIKDLWAVWKMYKALKKIKPNIVHTHTPKAGIVGMIAAKMADVPHRIHTVAGLPLEVATGTKRTILERVEKMTYKYATEVWPNSNSLRQFILDHEFTTADKLHVIGKGSSNGIDTSEFDPASLDEDRITLIKKELAYNEDCKYLLFVGRVVHDKGVEELVEAFVDLYKSDESLRLIIVGPLENELDPLSERTSNLIASHAGIIATGYSSYVKYYMHIADLFVFPSHREGFPNVLMQAALMNCPIVCSRINGNIDVVTHGETGLIFEKENVRDIKEKISKILADNTLRNEVANACRDNILKNSDRKNVQALILEKYNSLIDE